MIWCSVDPGKSGAIVRWVDDKPETFLAIEVPKGQRFFGPDQLADFTQLFEFCEVVVMEAFLDNQMSRQSTIHANTTAANHGIQQACIHLCGAELEIVRAADWKRRMGVAGKTVDKYAALDAARNLYPELADTWLRRKKDLDTAEALLIGHDRISRRLADG